MSPARRMIGLWAIGGGLLWAPRAAADGPVLGVDGEWVRAASTDDLPSDTGVGVGARLGYQSEALLLYLRPELGASTTFFDAIDEDIQWRGFGGARLGLATGLSPAVYIHAGYGWYSGDENGFTWDFGGTLDLYLLSALVIGAHLSYVLNPDPVANWLTVGGHVELFFY